MTGNQIAYYQAKSNRELQKQSVQIEAEKAREQARHWLAEERIKTEQFKESLALQNRQFAEQQAYNARHFEQLRNQLAQQYDLTQQELAQNRTFKLLDVRAKKVDQWLTGRRDDRSYDIAKGQLDVSKGTLDQRKHEYTWNYLGDVVSKTVDVVQHASDRLTDNMFKLAGLYNIGGK